MVRRLRGELFGQIRSTKRADFWDVACKLVEHSRSASCIVTKLCHCLQLLHDLDRCCPKGRRRAYSGIMKFRHTANPVDADDDDAPMVKLGEVATEEGEPSSEVVESSVDCSV